MNNEGKSWYNVELYYYKSRCAICYGGYPVVYQGQKKDGGEQCTCRNILLYMYQRTPNGYNTVAVAIIEFGCITLNTGNVM